MNRFRNGIDLLDLKQIVPNDLFSEYGFAEKTDFITVGQKCPIAK